jgi:DNA-binding response OmpR family regulator
LNVSGHILIVDDDVLLRRSLAFNLEKAGYRASTAATAEDALGISRHDRPDLVLLDISLPEMDGLEALHHFQDEIGAAVIFLTARRRELDEILGLELGADDYITKPFSTDLLLARVKAVLRRAAHPATLSTGHDSLQVGDLCIDPTAHTVTLGGKQIDLAPRTFDLLHVLALHAGRVLAAEKLLSLVWGAEYEGEPQVLYVHIRWLREKLEENPSDPRRIITVRGVGYKLIPVEGN